MTMTSLGFVASGARRGDGDFPGAVSTGRIRMLTRRETGPVASAGSATADIEERILTLPRGRVALLRHRYFGRDPLREVAAIGISTDARQRIPTDHGAICGCATADIELIRSWGLLPPGTSTKFLCTRPRGGAAR